MEHGKYLQIAMDKGNTEIVDLLNQKGFKDKVKKGVMESLLERNEKIMGRRTENLNGSFMSLSKLSVQYRGSPRRPTVSMYSQELMPSRRSKTNTLPSALESAPTLHSLGSPPAPVANSVPKTMQFNSYKRLTQVN